MPEPGEGSWGCSILHERNGLLAKIGCFLWCQLAQGQILPLTRPPPGFHQQAYQLCAFMPLHHPHRGIFLHASCMETSAERITACHAEESTVSPGLSSLSSAGRTHKPVCGAIRAEFSPPATLSLLSSGRQPAKASSTAHIIQSSREGVNFFWNVLFSEFHVDRVSTAEIVGCYIWWNKLTLNLHAGFSWYELTCRDWVQMQPSVWYIYL